MLDFELAEIYGYETKNFNRQVKNNSAKFEGDDFMFQLSKDEWENLRCKKFTSSWGGLRYLPMAFTEQGLFKNWNNPCYPNSFIIRVSSRIRTKYKVFLKIYSNNNGDKIHHLL